MTLRSFLLALLAFTAGTLASRPAAAEVPAPVIVLAASSLTETLQRVGAAWTAEGHPTVTFSFDASGRRSRAPGRWTRSRTGS